MEKAYLETSAINQILCEKVSVNNLSGTFKSQGILPAVGTHVIYELAKTFLERNRQETARALFQILNILELSYIPSTNMLLDQELNDKYRQNCSVLPFFFQINQASVRSEVAWLAAGNFSKEAEEFIRKREIEMRTSVPRISQEYIQHIQKKYRYGNFGK